MSTFLNEVGINDSAIFLGSFPKLSLTSGFRPFEGETVSEENVLDWISKNLRMLFDKVNFGFNYFNNVTLEGFTFDERVLTANLRNPNPETIAIIQNCLFSHRIMPKRVKKGHRLQMLWRLSYAALPPFTQLFSEIKIKFERACMSVNNCAFEQWNDFIKKGSIGVREFFAGNEMYRDEIVKQAEKNVQYNKALQYVVGRKCVVATNDPYYYEELIARAQSIDQYLYTLMQKKVDEFYARVGFGQPGKVFKRPRYYSIYVPDGTYNWAKEYLERSGFEVSYAPLEEEYKYLLNVGIGLGNTEGLKIYIKR